MVDVTQVCNLTCIHCPHPTFKKSQHYDGSMLEPALNRKMAEEVKEFGKGITNYIRYTSNGEPLLHKNIMQFLADSKKLSGTTVTLTTNGTLLNTNKIEELIDTGIDIVDISIDAYYDETYKTIRGGNLKITRGNVLNLIKLINEVDSTLKVVVSYIEQPQNRKETNYFKEYWESEGASRVVVRAYHSCSGFDEELANKFHEQQKNIERHPCLYPWERVVLNDHGYLTFCPQDWINGSLIVDYRKTTIKDTWAGKFYKDLRKAHKTCDFTDFGFCGQCPDWIHTNWPNEGIAYADMVDEFKSTE